MKCYGIMKQNAIDFANERNKPVYLTKALRNNHYVIFFNPDDVTPRHKIIEVVKPEKEDI